MQEHQPARRAEGILVVENDSDVAELFVMMFDLLGYEIRTAMCPKQAIEIAKDMFPDVVLTSLVFNDMDGFELCKRLRQMPGLANSRIVALTGLQFDGIDVKCKQAGFDQYLLKPFTMETLANAVDPADGERVKQMINR